MTTMMEYSRFGLGENLWPSWARPAHLFGLRRYSSLLENISVCLELSIVSRETVLEQRPPHDLQRVEPDQLSGNVAGGAGQNCAAGHTVSTGTIASTDGAR